MKNATKFDILETIEFEDDFPPDKLDERMTKTYQNAKKEWVWDVPRRGRPSKEAMDWPGYMAPTKTAYPAKVEGVWYWVEKSRE
jgi:hypothetical protein